MYRNLVVLLLCLVPVLAGAKQSYPPYPEVWGYDIIDDANTASANVTPMSLSNGDYIFLYHRLRLKVDKDVQGAIFHFFEGTKREFKTSNELNKYLDSKGGVIPPEVTEYIKLKDKKIIDVAINNKAYLKYNNNHNKLHYSYIRRIDNFRDANTDYKLSAIGITVFCESDNKCKNLAYFLAPSFIGLKDDTFIAFDDDYHLFIRFDKDFKTKFKSQHRIKLDQERELKSNFYVMPYSKIEYFFDHLVQRYAGEYNDDINRQFLDYLYEEESKGNI